MKLLNIIALVLIVGFMILSVYAMNYVQEHKLADMLATIGYGNYYGPDINKITIETGQMTLISLIVIGLFYVINLVKIKVKLVKTLAYTGLLLTAGCLILDGMMLQSPGHLSYDEMVWFFYAYGAISFIFFIIFLLKSGKISKSA